MLYLSLANNDISNIAIGSFSHLPALLELNLAHNNISNIAIGLFLGLDKLELLDLSFNQLEHVPANMLADCKSLNHLDLQGNKLFTINTLFAEHVTTLTSLNVRNNKLKYLPNAVLDNLATSAKLELSGNPWNCSSCELMPLVRYIRQTMPSTEDVKCSSSNKYVVNVNLDCVQTNYNYAAISLGVALSLVSIVLFVGVLVYRRRVDIQVIVYAKYGKKWRSSKPKSVDKYEYDAFISFNSHLNRFVIDELMPKLEKEKRYR